MSQEQALVNGNGHLEHETYILSSEVSYSTRTAGCVAFLKRPSPLAADVPISRQISVVNLPFSSALSATSDTGSSGSAYDGLHSLVRGALTPFFEAAARGSGSSNDKFRSDGESRTGISGARRKLADLEVSLQNLQQNIEVEAPRLQISEAVQTQLDEADGNWQAAATQIPEELITDSTLLNRLQNMANEWIKQIRDFVRLTDERPVGTRHAREKLLARHGDRDRWNRNTTVKRRHSAYDEDLGEGEEAWYYRQFLV